MAAVSRALRNKQYISAERVGNGTALFVGLSIVGLFLILIIYHVTFSILGAEPGTNVSRWWMGVFIVLLSFWLHCDKRGQYRFPTAGSVLLWMWPYTLPVYLFRTRGAKGI
ncbi:hypothetical protein ACFSJ3_03935 [Corallincola platygyrae]|uniref:DUF805 domain-containing protein n=1 Tax=Corallincola platygyrae TaxID=1193278 RepID=A0ABW4XHY9_9GAMM